MPSKLSVHLSSYPTNTFDILARMQPSVVKVYNQSSEMNVDEIRRLCPNTILVYRQYTNLDYHAPADAFFAELGDTFNKLRGRGIVWEGINEPIVNTVDDAQALNAWYVRFAQLMRAQGELVAGFSWSTGNPTPDKLALIIPHLAAAAAACDVHAFHEYYSAAGQQNDWTRYRNFERALPAASRKPVLITEAGYDDGGDPRTSGYRGKLTNDEYLNLLRAYDALIQQDPYVLGATVYQWGDGAWPSFELAPLINTFADLVANAGGGLIPPKPWPTPNYDPPSPTFSFTADPLTIVAGKSTTLRWEVSAAQAVYLDGQSVDLRGTRVVTPAQTATYKLRIVFADATTKELATTVTVTANLNPQITGVTLTPTSVRAGQLLAVSITVLNSTNQTLPTQDPAPGFVYEEGDTFYTRGFADTRGAFRVGIDFDGRTGIDHPYRWGLGAPLAPGQSVTITGAIRLKTARAIEYWAGLVREQIAWIEDAKGKQAISVLPVANVVQITSVTLTPTTFVAGAQLQVRITVENHTSDTLPTQDPAPGFVYEEGDTFMTRGFAETRGAFRVGIDFDGRTGIDHPYRWGLGAPLAPGQSTTITGAIRLKTARAINYWAGLVRERIAWVQDQQGKQVITVTPGGALQILAATLTPTALPAGGLLNVSITVKNNSSEPVITQGPEPGLTYTEGETFYTRGFPEVAGATRVGIDFDGRTGIDHPFRWGLSKTLAPGETATITGAIKLQTAREIHYWAGLVRERVAWLEDRQGAQLVNVFPPPTVTFTATPERIQTGQSSKLEWNVTSAGVVLLDGQTVAAQGSQFVAPVATTTYTLTLVFLDGTMQELTRTISVTPVMTATFTATPATIPPGVAATLAWQTQGATQVTLDGETVTAIGTRAVTPAATTTYALRVVFADGSVRDLTATVAVQAVKSATLSVTPDVIQTNGAATLRWETQGATQVTLDGATVAATDTRAVSPQQTTTYALRVTFFDGEVRDLTTTVTVVPGPTRPPTVVITPANAAKLKTYPRPTNDNGRGLHFNIDLRASTVARAVTHLQSINAKWTLIYAQDELQAKNTAQPVWAAGIMPVVRLGKKVDEPFDPAIWVSALKSVNVPLYLQIYNEPGDVREWKTWPGEANWGGIFAYKWALAAAAVYDAGGYPGLQVLGPEEFDAVVSQVAANGRQDIWERAFFCVHNYGANHPPSYPYDINLTIFQDDVAVLVPLYWAKKMQERIGFVLPIIGGEGGWQYGAQEDLRYPKVESPLHARYHAEMFDWFRTGILSNGEPLPDYLFSITPWIEGGWGGDDWWGGPLGDKTETINAVAALPPFVRKFSWDDPTPTVYFTASPNPVVAGAPTTLQWVALGARAVMLDGAPVETQGTRAVTLTQTTTYALHIVFNDGSTRDISLTVQVESLPPLVWDARLDPLGVKLTRATAPHAWRLVSAIYQDETESNGNHNIYYTTQNANGTPAANIQFVLDWNGRNPADDPGYTTTDANGEANIPLWAILHPELQDGPYFTNTVNQPSDTVSGMGLPVNRHVNFLLTYRWI